MKRKLVEIMNHFPSCDLLHAEQQHTLGYRVKLIQFNTLRGRARAKKKKNQQMDAEYWQCPDVTTKKRAPQQVKAGINTAALLVTLNLDYRRLSPDRAYSKVSHTASGQH